MSESKNKKGGNKKAGNKKNDSKNGLPWWTAPLGLWQKIAGLGKAPLGFLQKIAGWWNRIPGFLRTAIIWLFFFSVILLAFMLLSPVLLPYLKDWNIQTLRLLAFVYSVVFASAIMSGIRVFHGATPNLWDTLIIWLAILGAILPASIWLNGNLNTGESLVGVIFYSAVLAGAIIAMWLAAVRNKFTDEQQNTEAFRRAIAQLAKTESHTSQTAGMRQLARLLKDNKDDMPLVKSVLRTLQDYLDGYTMQAQALRSHMSVASTMALHIIHDTIQYIVENKLDPDIEPNNELFYRNFENKDLSFMDFVQEIPNLELPFTVDDSPELNLRRANFKGATLWETNLQGAGLQNADFTLSKFGNVTSDQMKGANVGGADFTGANAYQSLQKLQEGTSEKDRYPVDENWLEKQGAKNAGKANTGKLVPKKKKK